MKRAKGATHTVRGFVSILGSKGGAKIEWSKTAAGERIGHPKPSVYLYPKLTVQRNIYRVSVQ